MSHYFKTVTDPIHGNIGLTKVEAEVMTSAVMQRLHNVRQLGLAHLVYPGANYSRFSHSIGACYNASNLIEAIGRNTGKPLTSELAQEYRLVALLHDVGHYPFSHATETVIQNHYVERLMVESPDAGTRSAVLSGPISMVEDAASIATPSPSSYDHEQLGEHIIRHNEELGKILKGHNIDPNAIADRFAKAKPDPLIGIISSDLDCDRLDYLKRTAHNSGAPYGSVDIRFLIDQATTDTDGIFCFKAKAARAADHLLVSRFYDYMQVPFNKTVAALEWSLVTSIKALLENGTLDCAGRSVEKMVADQSWNHFDDQKVFEHFRKLLPGTKNDPILRDHLKAILDRRPAKIIAGWDEVVKNDDQRTVAKNEFIAKSILKDVANEFSLDLNRLHVWTTPVYFSKADGSIASEHQEEERIAEAVQVLDEQTGKASLLLSRTDTLVHHLSSLHMAGLRLYYLPQDGELGETTAKGIIKRFSDALGKPCI